MGHCLHGARLFWRGASHACLATPPGALYECRMSFCFCSLPISRYIWLSSWSYQSTEKRGKSPRKINTVKVFFWSKQKPPPTDSPTDHQIRCHQRGRSRSPRQHLGALLHICQCIPCYGTCFGGMFLSLLPFLLTPPHLRLTNLSMFNAMNPTPYRNSSTHPWEMHKAIRSSQTTL